MAQKVKQSDNLHYTVEAVPALMSIPDGTANTGFFVNRRTDTLSVLGVVTERYGIVQNDDLVSVAEDAFKVKGLTDYNRRVVVTGDGEKMRVVYDFKNQTKKMAVGDEIGFRLTLGNSFDGSIRASFSLGSLRLICLNGASSLENEVGMTKKHSAGVNVDFVSRSLDKAIAGWEKTINVYNRLAAISITQEQGVNILANLESQGTVSEKLREGIAGIWANPTHREDSNRNLWNLFNASSQYLTHEVSGERFELANRTDNTILRAFDRVSRDTSRFAALVAPVAVPLVGVVLN